MFSNFIFDLKNVLKKIKKIKKGFRFCAGPTWMRCGTLGHVTAPRGPMRRLRGFYVDILFIYIVYIMGIQPSVYRKGFQTLHSLGLINPTISFSLFRVGLIHTMC